MSIFLINGTYIDAQNLTFAKKNIKINNLQPAKIEFFEGPIATNELKKEDKIIDCTNKWITKSFVCGHHHIYSALARGMPAPPKIPVNFYEILQYVWWRLDKCLDEESIIASALYTAMACAKNGVTFIIDHHASPNYIKNSLSLIAQQIEKVGLSHLLCYEVTDRDGIDKATSGLYETEQYLSMHQGLVGLHASFTVSDETLKDAVFIAEKFNSGIHIHVAEDKYDQEHCLKTYNKRVIQRLHDAGALQLNKTILGHCIHIDEREVAILKQCNTWLVQNMESNLNNNVGVFKANGINNVMLGTDGMHSDMLRSAKNAFFVGCNYESVSYSDIYNRFRNAHQYLKQNQFAGDGAANLLVLNYDSPTPFSTENFASHFIFGLESRHVQHVIANGKLVVENQRLTMVNEEEILNFCQKAAEKLWLRLQKLK